METVLFFNTYYLYSLACSFNHRELYANDVRCDSVSVSTQMLNVFQPNIIMTNVSHIMILFSTVACSLVSSAFYFATRLHKKKTTNKNTQQKRQRQQKKSIGLLNDVFRTENVLKCPHTCTQSIRCSIGICEV